MEHDTSTDPLATAAMTGRCAACGGALRQGAPWCTLCLAPTAEAPAPGRAAEAAPAPAPAPGSARLDPLTAPLELLLAASSEPGPAPSSPTWPCASCSAPNPLDAVACGACGSGFLEQVRRSEGPLLVLPLVGDLSRLDKLQSLMLATAVVVAMLTVTLLVGVLLG